MNKGAGGNGADGERRCRGPGSGTAFKIGGGGGRDDAAASAVIGTSPQLPGSTFGLTRLETNLPVGIPGKYDVESTR